MSHDARIVAQFTKMAGAALRHSPEHARDAEERVRAAIRKDMLEADSRLEGDAAISSYPIAVLTARKTR